MDGEGMQHSGGPAPGSEAQNKSLQPTPIFIAAEKNLETIGFFSPATKALRWMQKKQISWNALRTNDDGQKEEVQVNVTIDGTAMGLPTTTDLDFYTAYQCILSRYILQQRAIPDPLVFTTKELLQIAGELKAGGDQRSEVRTWLKRMQKTFVESRAAVYDADKGRWIVTVGSESGRSYQDRQMRRVGINPKRDRWDNLQVFVQCHQEGELIKGRRLEANVVYAAPWYKKNIERHWTKPVHATLYFRLRKPMAKILFRVGDGLLYAGEGSAHKRYDELCTVLGIPAYQHEARIRQQIAGALDELQQVGYLARWGLRRSADRCGWVVEWFGGDVWNRIQKEIRGIEGASNYALPRPVEETAQDHSPRGAEKKVLAQLPLSFAPQAPPVGEGKRELQQDPQSAECQVPRERVGELIQLFRKHRRHPPMGRPPAHEVERAEYLLAEYGWDKAAFVVEYACQEIPKTSGRSGWGRFFGSVMSYVGEALEAYTLKQEAKKTVQAVQTGPTLKELVAKRRAELSPVEIEILRQRAIQAVKSNPFVAQWLKKYQGGEVERERDLHIERTIESFLEQELLSKLRPN